MKKSKLTGWKNVFSFTFTQTAKSKAFLSSTILIGVILFVAMMGINLYSAFDHMQEKVDEVSEIVINDTEETTENKPSKKEFAHTIYVLDETNFDFSFEQIEKYINKKYDGIKFYITDQNHEDMLAQMEQGDEQEAYLHLGYGVSGIEIDLYLSGDTVYSELDGEKFTDRIASYINRWKDSYLGLSKEQSEFLSMDISTTVLTKEHTPMVETIAKMYLPMIICLVLYLCIILYGQMVGTSVATEKSSKVMELLLTSIRPLAIIVGKVLSTMTLALTQFALWIVIAFVGNGVGTIMATRMNPEYHNILLDLLTEFDLLSVFSPIRILFAIVVFVLGFTFYCTLAGLIGATVNRGEDLSSAMSIYSTISVIGFMFAYLPNVLGNVGSGIQTFAAIFPLSSPFILPAKILMGEMAIGFEIAGIVVLLVVVIIFTILVSKIYEMIILYNGNKIGFKQIKQIMQNAKTEEV